MIIVSGKAKVKPGAVEKVRAVMEATIKATREETGCIDYSYGLDVLDPNTIVVLEYWETAEALQAHFTQPHMAEWMKALGEAGVIEQDIRAFEIASERQLLG
ncbi:MAG: antibiotic biosynthesis monooxygenase [Marinicaulis sp.]|nr:antibiotic biosynthesis monooxygenase [Marinicaulis sp.]